MKNKLPYFILISVLFTSLQCKGFETTISNFDPPRTMEELDDWEKQGEFYYLQQPSSPYTPRVLKAYSGPEFNVYSFQEAFKDLESAVDIQVKQEPIFKKLEANEKWDGTDYLISLTPTKYAGVDGVLFLLISKLQKDKNYYMIGLEMAQKTYAKWGGVARMLTLRGIINDAFVYSKNALGKLRMTLGRSDKTL